MSYSCSIFYFWEMWLIVKSLMTKSSYCLKIIRRNPMLLFFNFLSSKRKSLRIVLFFSKNLSNCICLQENSSESSVKIFFSWTWTREKEKSFFLYEKIKCHFIKRFLLKRNDALKNFQLILRKDKTYLLANIS